MNQDIPPDAADRAQALFGDLIEGRWEEVGRESAGRLGEHAVMKFARGWRDMADSAGSFKRIGTPAVRQSGDYTVVDAPLIAGRGEAIGKVVFDSAGKVAGLALEYPRHRYRLDPRPVRTLFLGNPETLGIRRTRI
ncbi:MAG: hypothetical protein ABSA02_30405 [Trebonia sp.]|jgi:hypothetical protein